MPQQKPRASKLILAVSSLLVILSALVGLLNWERTSLVVEPVLGPLFGLTPRLETQNVDHRFGVIVTNRTSFQQTLRVVGLPWYMDFSYNPDGIPQGAQKAMKVRTGRLTTTKGVTEAARARPGSYWLIGNEPNAPGQDDVSPESYAQSFHDYVNFIKGADPTAKIVGPEILNFDHTCLGCPGFPAGREWLTGFIRAYRERYGDFPPIDVWSIHTYDLNWERLPLGDAMAQLGELTAFRSYLDTMPQSRNMPIWLTEFSVMWGYDSIRWDEVNGEYRAAPVGALNVDHLKRYLVTMTDALRMRSAELHLERWFLFATHPYAEDWATAPGGISLVDGAGTDIRLSALGQLYRSLAEGRPQEQ